MDNMAVESFGWSFGCAILQDGMNLEIGPMGNISYIVIFRAYDNRIMEVFTIIVILFSHLWCFSKKGIQ